MSHENKTIIRCRAIIINDGKLLVVKHKPNSDFYALPGGHLEWGEGVKECMIREIIEELGVRPEPGRLLYVNTFIDKTRMIHSVEFFFEVLNAKDYVNTETLSKSHAHEIAESRWIGQEENVNILPEKITADFKAGTILSDIVRYNVS